MKKRSRAAKALLPFSLGLLLVSCPPPPKPATLDEIAARALSYERTPAKDAVVNGINAFGISLYTELASESQANIFLSPYSVSTALAMTYAGARNATETQMAEVLHYAVDQAALPAAYAAVNADVAAVGGLSAYALDITSSLWGQKDIPFQADFLAVLSDAYGAPLKTVDFINATGAARDEINGWVSDRTRGRITEILSPDSLNVATRLVLANAMYFKGTWARTFETARTASSSFTLEDGTSVSVPMMHQDAEFNFMQNEQLEMLELPYTTGDLSMIFILPQYGRTLCDVESALNADTVAEWTSQLNAVEDLAVGIPRFTFSSSFALSTQLAAMGMTDAFDSTRADFSGMTGSRDLSIGDVHHKAFVLVNEEGTEAAAATVVWTVAMATGYSFYADHPFIFLIRHNRSGAILFLGRVMDPR